MQSQFLRVIYSVPLPIYISFRWLAGVQGVGSVPEDDAGSQYELRENLAVHEDFFRLGEQFLTTLVSKQQRSGNDGGMDKMCFLLSSWTGIL